MIKSFTALVAFLCLGPPSLPPAPPAAQSPVPQVAAVLRVPPETLREVPLASAEMVEMAVSASEALAASGPARKLDPRFKARLEVLIKKYAKKHGVDEKLVQAVLCQESGGNPRAVSPKGAQGLMQLMPDTAQALGVQNAFDPEENVAGGVKYLKHCLQRFQQNVVLALAAYNAGPEAVEKYHGVPPYEETEQYVASITRAYKGKAWAKNEPKAAGPAPGKEEAGLDWKVPAPTWKIAEPEVQVSAPRWKAKSPGLTQGHSLLTDRAQSNRKLADSKADQVLPHPRGLEKFPHRPLSKRHLASSVVETDPARAMFPPVRSTENIP
jgi:hypothetical protein